MDPITTAIVAALASDLTKTAIKNSYNALKNALKKKFGSESDLIDAINKLEKTPERDDRKATVKVEVEITKVNDDPEIVQLAQELLDKLKEQPGGQQVITQTISHVKYAATSGTGTASISNVTEHQASKDN